MQPCLSTKCITKIASKIIIIHAFFIEIPTMLCKNGGSEKGLVVSDKFSPQPVNTVAAAS